MADLYVIEEQPRVRWRPPRLFATTRKRWLSAGAKAPHVAARVAVTHVRPAGFEITAKSFSGRSRRSGPTHEDRGGDPRRANVLGAVNRGAGHGRGHGHGEHDEDRHQGLTHCARQSRLMGCQLLAHFQASYVADAKKPATQASSGLRPSVTPAAQTLSIGRVNPMRTTFRRPAHISV